MQQIKTKSVSNSTTERLNILPSYDNYIALDWSKAKMSIARISNKRPDKIKVIDTQSDLKELKQYLMNLQGDNILTFEESTSAQWLYVELLDRVDRIIICDPFKNKLLSDGPKNDPIDAKKLCSLLKAGLLTEVYHTTDNLYQLRKYVSAYEDIVKMGVRLKNQRSGFLAQIGKTKKTKERNFDKASDFIIEKLDKGIENYKATKKNMNNCLNNFAKKINA